MSESGNPMVKTWHGVPRAEIAWNPTLIDERCLGCGLCVTSCGRQVYQFDSGRNVPVVANPRQCMVYALPDRASRPR